MKRKLRIDDVNYFYNILEGIYEKIGIQPDIETIDIVLDIFIEKYGITESTTSDNIQKLVITLMGFMIGRIYENEISSGVWYIDEDETIVLYLQNNFGVFVFDQLNDKIEDLEISIKHKILVAKQIINKGVDNFIKEGTN